MGEYVRKGASAGSRRYRETGWQPDRHLAIPTLTEAMALCAVLENGHAVGALTPTTRRHVGHRGWLAKPPKPGAAWQVSPAGLTALRRVDVGERAIQLRLDALHAEALGLNEERARGTEK